MGLIILVSSMFAFLALFYLINPFILRNDACKKHIYYFSFLTPLVLIFIFTLALRSQGYDKLYVEPSFYEKTKFFFNMHGIIKVHYTKEFEAWIARTSLHPLQQILWQKQIDQLKDI